MTMTAIGGALTAASGFFGLGGRLRADAPAARPAADDAFAPQADGPAPGDPWFEAVAEALAEAGYLDS
ncbi:hypothetical protein ACFZ8E_01010 [Methylobacterium sp. HMF5984]|uniref:hypothetical protein n=1 Tax=unclassified Methylobacterium TaxID=2615210 RepID=UPI001FB968F1|nr:MULTISPECIES: hypothetical protein [unclassified Methylobacterium]MCJ2007630.1 hypothetical protein [Methylobacterium sp. J-092]MCJ2078203.1 hypothetical protein [Methylobacterium sp. E-016]